jgi:hypothetical protein
VHPIFESKLLSIPSGAGRLLAILKFARGLTDDVIDSMGGNSAVAEYVKSLYVQYVVPLDLPGVPNLLEPMVDEAIKGLIVTLINAVDDEK